MREKPSASDNVDFVPIRRISALSLFNFRKFKVNQHFIQDIKLMREECMRVHSVCWIGRAKCHLRSIGKGY